MTHNGKYMCVCVDVRQKSHNFFYCSCHLLSRQAVNIRQAFHDLDCLDGNEKKNKNKIRRRKKNFPHSNAYTAVSHSNKLPMATTTFKGYATEWEAKVKKKKVLKRHRFSLHGIFESIYVSLVKNVW